VDLATALREGEINLELAVARTLAHGLRGDAG